MEYNIYCDESCHLERDKNDIIVLGGIRCDELSAKKINEEIKEIKKQFGYKVTDEIKWTKVSPANVDFFLYLIDYFFKKEELFFRGYIGRGKEDLNHERHSQSYNDWYYKMYYRMIEVVVDKDRSVEYNIYIDIKDTIGKEKIDKLRKMMNKHFDSIINKIQLVRSHEIALLQLTDLLIGALSYKNRGLHTSEAKIKIIERIEKLSGCDLLQTVPLRNQKVNWFVWTPDSWR